mgnify:CR=1 FL=1
MKRSFDNSIQHARSKYLPVVGDEQPVKVNRTNNLIEGMMNDLAGSVKKGIGKVAGATQKLRTFAQNQKHGGTFAAMGNAGMFDPKGDSQLVRAEWDKLDAGAKKAWDDKGKELKTATGEKSPLEGKDYFYNQRMADRAKDKNDAVGAGGSSGSNTGSETKKTPAQQDQAWREAFRNDPAVQQLAQTHNMDEDQYVQFMKAQQQ